MWSMISSRPVRKLGDIQQGSNSKWSVSLQLKVIAMAWLGRRPRRSVGGTENPLREAMRFGHPDRQPGVFHVGLIGSFYILGKRGHDEMQRGLAAFWRLWMVMACHGRSGTFHCLKILKKGNGSKHSKPSRDSWPRYTSLVRLYKFEGWSVPMLLSKFQGDPRRNFS
jgi:hypothetical protein